MNYQILCLGIVLNNKMDTECDGCLNKGFLVDVVMDKGLKGNPMAPIAVDDLLDEHDDGPSVRGQQMQTQPGVVQQAQDHQGARDFD